MKPAATVMACIDNHGILLSATAQQFGIGFTETFAVHAFDMHISDFSVRQLVDHLALLFHPTLVE